MKIKTRLYVPNVSLAQENIEFCVSPEQAHYLRHVLRAQVGDYIGVFNAEDGEYACDVIEITKKHVTLRVQNKIRDILRPDPITLVFAPIKKAPLAYLIQKATELGAAELQPVLTHRTVIRDVNLDKLNLVAIEAAEQCGLTVIPKIHPIIPFEDILFKYNAMIFCDERGGGSDIATQAQTLAQKQKPIDSILIGPEGGFSPEESDMLYQKSDIYPVTLGPRIMRAETAAIASLAIVQSITRLAK